MAAKSLFANEKLIPYKTIPACIDAVAEKEVDVAIVPIENAIEGSVNMTLDYLIHKQRLPIVGGVTVPIAQHLLVHPDNKEEQIEKVISHPHAIAQCHDFLREYYPNAQWEYMDSTGAAAAYVAENRDEKVGAIANELAGVRYHLHTLHDNVHDYNHNHTSFIVLSAEGENFQCNGHNHIEDKTTLMVTLPSDYSGALHQVLSAFAWRKLNLTKIESRPTKTGLGNYFFIIDVEGRMDNVLIPGVISELEALGCGVDVLGSYPCFSLTEKKEKV